MFTGRLASKGNEWGELAIFVKEWQQIHFI
jgi:hypothetical protein